MAFVAVRGGYYPTIEVGAAFGQTPTAATPTYTDITPYVRGLTIRRGRQDQLGTVDAGRIELVLNNRDGRFMPEYTGGAYYPNIVPLVRIRVRAQWNAVTYDLCHGYVEAWRPLFPAYSKDAVVQCTALDRFTMFHLEILDGPTFAEQLTGARIAALLTTFGVPAAEQNIDTGDHTVAAEEADPATGKSQVTGELIHYFQEVAAADPGLFFIRADGEVVYQDRRHRQDDESAVHMTLGDLASSTTECRYLDIDPTYDTAQLWSQIAVTYQPSHYHSTEPLEERIEDSTSVTNYRRRTLPITTRLVKPGEAQAVAGYYLYQYKQPKLRFPRVALRPRSNVTAHWAGILGLELSKRLTINRRPPWGGTITQDVHVEGISHSIAPGGPWDVQVDVSPAYTYTEWVLNTSVLGTNTNLAV